MKLSAFEDNKYF